jgi:hypothetical protein
VRTFPDSSARDHLEHEWSAHWRRLLAGAGWFGLDGEGERRSTLNPVNSTRDNFWRQRAGAEFESGVLVGPWLRARVEGELLRYDVPDSEVYENENRLRVQVLPGLRPGLGRSYGVGPRLEWLRSPQQPAEDYTELAAVAELEWTTLRSVWSAMPAAGRRNYREALQRELSTPILHTSYNFYELDLVADQRLPASLRLRGLLDGRLEHHTNPADDTRSLYFSIDLRMLF